MPPTPPMERPRLHRHTAMFQGEQGSSINIHGGQFIQQNQPPPTTAHDCSDADDGFKHLQAHVATTAFDSAQQVDAPKCHPNTRLAVLNEIMDWILLTVTRVQWMMWLNGAAGAGKSAIARSIVALCLARNIPVARFFFFRTDSTRNTIQPIVATLVHQLMQQIPELSAIVIPQIDSDPLIFTKSLGTQLQYLIFEPLKQLHCNCPLKNIVVLLLDGVDECNDEANQTDIVRVIANCLSGRDLPIIVFFGSRAEYHLQQVFRSHDISENLLQLALDHHYLPDHDIYLFLNDKFKQIKETHSLKHLLDDGWPKTAHIKEIVVKSSGQFIYASVVINFVSSPRKHPIQQLDIIRGLRPTGNLTPFVQLDALYRHIFAQIENITRTSLILAWAIFSNIDIICGFDSEDIPVLLVDLASILTYENGKIHFLHASLPDFLLSPTRSQRYYLNKRLWCTHLSIICLHRIYEGVVNAFYPLIFDFLPYAEGTAELRDHVLALNFNLLHLSYFSTLMKCLQVIRTLNFGDDGELYRSQLKRLMRCSQESEQATELERLRTAETGHAPIALDVLQSSRDSRSPAYEVAVEFVEDTDTFIPSSETGGTTGDVEAEVAPRQTLKRPTEHTPILSHQEQVNPSKRHRIV
ncbi:hypothetical protein HYPSUDRAFT_49507 [Hypholoma sublateritium FD-334 SS-4]|uniref:Nephrocystin 3-like N-terminal domain-containing protein n=1 Tax=Hypholoma sublateritium (strain FD-334 SS-4) TaxID=945553 RepID=A0A0D2NBK4_HYPSF|nr:hypothetical protein HYPSUDRAFT_49507 [Hypholoma sublateritium FD-334 SS-4]